MLNVYQVFKLISKLSLPSSTTKGHSSNFDHFIAHLPWVNVRGASLEGWQGQYFRDALFIFLLKENEINNDIVMYHIEDVTIAITKGFGNKKQFSTLWAYILSTGNKIIHV